MIPPRDDISSTLVLHETNGQLTSNINSTKTWRELVVELMCVEIAMCVLVFSVMIIFNIVIVVDLGWASSLSLTMHSENFDISHQATNT